MAIKKKVVKKKIKKSLNKNLRKSKPKTKKIFQKKTTKTSDLVIPLNTKIEGSLLTNGNLIIHGEVKGNIKCSNIIIETKGKITGTISSFRAVIMGIADADFHVKNDIFIKKTSTVMGKVNYDNNLTIEPGSKVYCQLIPKKKPLLLPFYQAEKVETEAENTNNKFYENKVSTDFDINPQYQKTISIKNNANKVKPFDKVIRSIFKK